MPLWRPRSLRRWLSRWLAVVTFIALGAISIAVYRAVNLNLQVRQDALLQQKVGVVQHLVSKTLRLGDSTRLKRKLEDFFFCTEEFSLRIEIDGAEMVYGDLVPGDQSSASYRQITFALPAAGANVAGSQAHLVFDVSPDVRLRSALAWTLFGCSLFGALMVAAIGTLLVGRALAPIDALGRQAASLSPERMNERLDESSQSEEIEPLVRQFNAVLERQQRAYLQMEGFSADVAHEMRTPLATLVGETELALRTRPSEAALREILGSNLEELQRLTHIVRDMLFLARADRGARVREACHAWVGSVIQEVMAFHEAEAADANVTITMQGDAFAPLDRTLLQRAVSNLLSNAIRYADPNSTILIDVAQGKENDVLVTVSNVGKPVSPKHLSRLFHRFYRIDAARACDAHHHGLGLSIVQAIAQMHKGRIFANADGRRFSIGFTLSKAG